MSFAPRNRLRSAAAFTTGVGSPNRSIAQQIVFQSLIEVSRLAVPDRLASMAVPSGTKSQYRTFPYVSSRRRFLRLRAGRIHLRDAFPRVKSRLEAFRLRTGFPERSSSLYARR